MRFSLSPFGVGALLFIAAVGCSEGTSSDHYERLDYESNPHSAKYDFGEVDDVVDQFMRDYPSVQGVTLAIVRGEEGQIYEEGYGAFDRDRISLIASTGKVLSAGIILSLVDEGLLDLDRPIAEYLNWGDHHPGVTMRHILSMMAGLPILINLSGVCLPHACECDPATTMQECARVVFEDESMSDPPGEEFHYSRWQLAGAVAEVASGRSWAELEREKLVEPCGLPDTGYRNFSIDGYPEAFDGDPSNFPETENPNLGGGAYSTVNDYSKVLLMHLGDGLCGGGRALSPEMVEAMQADLVPEGLSFPFWRDDAVNYGMGWWKLEDAPGLLVDSGAFGARSMIHPEEDWGAIFILEDTSANGTELRKRLVPEIRAALLGGTAGNGVTSVCVPTEDQCMSSISDPIEEMCPVVVPEQESACIGDEPLMNPTSCSGSGSVVAHRLTAMQVVPDCSAGFDLDGCRGHSCAPGGLSEPEGASGIDNQLAALGPVFAGVGWNLGQIDQAFHEAICSGVLDIVLETELVPDEGCAIVTVVSAGLAGEPIAMNLSDSGCLSGGLGAFPVRVGEAEGFIENAVVRMTVSPRGFSDGILGGTVEELTAGKLFDEAFPYNERFWPSAIALQSKDINADLSWGATAACDSLSITLELGGHAVAELL